MVRVAPPPPPSEDEFALLLRENQILRQRLARIEALLVPADFEVPSEWALSPRERDVYAVLALRAEAVPPALMMQALYGGEDARHLKTLRVLISKIRNKTARHGVRIDTVTGGGWRLRAGPRVGAQA